jgi:hypothetical protein
MSQEDEHWLSQKKDLEPLVSQELQSTHSWLMVDSEVESYRISSHPYEQIVTQESRSRDQQNQESNGQQQMELFGNVSQAESDDTEHIQKDESKLLSYLTVSS